MKGQEAIAEIETQVPLKHKTIHFYRDGGQTLESVAQRACGVSIPGDIQKPNEHSTGQPALAKL